MPEACNTSPVAASNDFFERKDPWGHGLSLWVFALLLFLAPMAVLALPGIRLDNNVGEWLPESDPSAIEYAWCRQHFPAQETLYLTWPGSTLDDPRLPVLIGELAGQVDEDGIRRGGLPYVSHVLHSGEILARMTEQGVEESEALRRLQGTAIGRGAIKVLLTPAARDHREQTVGQLKLAAAREFGIQLQVTSALKTWEPEAYLATAFDAQQQRFASLKLPAPSEAEELVPQHDLQIAWPGMGNQQELQQRFLSWLSEQSSPSGLPMVENGFTSIGSPIAVLITLSDAGVAETVKTMAAIKAAAARAMIPIEDVVMGGGIVSAAELNSAVIRAAWNPASKTVFGRSVLLLSGLVGIAFALISLRNWRLGLVVIGAAYYAALLGIAIVPLTGGKMSMVLVVMPTLLMVLSLSGAIHIANYWKHAAGEDPDRAVAHAVKMAYQPCLLASFTTGLGLISLAASPLAPVRDFGIYSSVGIVISISMILYGLPTLLQMTPQPRTSGSQLQSRNWTRFGEFVCRNWRLTMASAMMLSLLCGIGLWNFQIETKVIKYFPEQSQVVRDFKWMEDSLAGTCPVEILVRFDAESQKATRFLERVELVRQIENQIRAHREVSGTLSLADFLPERESPDDSTNAREKILYNRRSHETEDRVKSGATTGAAELVTMSNSPLPNEAARKGTDELWRINAQCFIVSDVDYAVLTKELNECVSRISTGHQGVDYFVTGTVPLFLQTQRAVLDSLITSFIMAFGLISLVMIVVLKDALAGVISMLPNILPVVMVFGLVSWSGQKIDIGTMVTASIALGIAVDGSLHLLTWFQDGLRRGLNRQQSVIASLAHCGPAMWQTSAAVGVGLLVLYPAELLLISRFGWLMAALIGTALLGDIILLPTLLIGSLGHLIERRLQLRGEIPVAETASTPLPEKIPADLPIPAPHFSTPIRANRKVH